MSFKLYTDGGARGNPGPAALGVVLKNAKGETVKEIGKCIGTATNNDAEYSGLVEGLKCALGKNVKKLKCYLDSELIVRQLNGDYKVKNVRMKVYFAEVKKLESKFESVTYTHINRDENAEADALVNQVLDAVMGD